MTAPILYKLNPLDCEKSFGVSKYITQKLLVYSDSCSFSPVFPETGQVWLSVALAFTHSGNSKLEAYLKN